MKKCYKTGLLASYFCNLLNKIDSEKKKLIEFHKIAIFNQNALRYVLLPVDIFVELT